MNCAVVILAGGEGRRIGGDKPRRLLAGRTLIDRTLERARSWSPVVAIAVRKNVPTAPPAIPILVDGPLEGPMAGLASALHFGRVQAVDAVLTIPCDTPMLPADLLDRLWPALVGYRAAVPTSAGRPHPTCALWRTDACDELPRYVTFGRSSLMGFASVVGHVRIDWSAEPYDPFFNVNDVEDLKAAEALVRMK